MTWGWGGSALFLGRFGGHQLVGCQASASADGSEKLNKAMSAVAW